MSDANEAALYSRIYHAPTDKTEDSPRFRVRLAASWERLDLKRHEFAEWVHSELGVTVPVIPNYGYTPGGFFKNAATRDVLDAITLTWRMLHSKSRGAPSEWLKDVNRILSEEGLGYRMNAKGGLRRVIDEQFEHVRQSVIAALEGDRYRNALDCFEEAHRHLAGTEPHRKAAVRSMFECVETLVRMLVGGKKLDPRAVRADLLPLLRAQFATDKPGELAIEKMGESLCDWVDGVHFYRHGQAQQEPVEPSDAFCVHVLTSGGGWVRWLADLDRKLNPPP